MSNVTTDLVQPCRQQAAVSGESHPAPHAPRTYRMRRRQQAGQSVLIVLGVLFLVAFLGALFVLVVIRNLENAQRQNQVLTADDYAQAGVNYANSMLQNSPLGADWRPPLQYGTTVANVPGYTGTLAAAPANDPDLTWLSEGYTRYNLANGRFLLRVTYNPAAASLGATGAPNTTPAPNSKYLRIDVVGRQGVVDSSDPTTYTNSPAESLRAERTAYKPIGLVDYARFITNKDNRSDTATLGVPSMYDATNGITTPGVMDIPSASITPGAGNVPTTFSLTPYPITTTFGGATAYASAANTNGGGSLRSNASLRLYGSNTIYLNGQFGDDWEVDGNLTFDQYVLGAPSPAVQPTQATVFGTSYLGPAFPATGQAVYPSNDAFSTEGGLFRDGSAGNDPQGNPRGIGRLNPPLIDTTDPVTNLTRYQVLTKQGTNQFYTAGVTATAGPPATAAMPATIYISNSGDIQTETTTSGDPSTLREEWLRTPGTAPHWDGNFYNPPGVLIAFGAITVPTTTGSASLWGITLTRSDQDASGNASLWPGTSSSTVRLVYGALPGGFTQDLSKPIFSLNVDAATTTTLPNDNDIVIYADGNVRVSGVVSNPNASTPGGTPTAQHVTIVTNGIGYVEGSILRGVEPSAPTATAAQAGASIALLATQYVCLNTTQFMAGPSEATGAIQPSPSSNAVGPGTDYFLDFTPGATLTFNELLPTVYANTSLYISQEQGPSSGNPNATTTGQGDFSINNAMFNPITQTIAGPAYPPYPASPSTPNKTVVPLNPTPTPYLPSFTPTALTPFALTFQTDPGSLNDWTLERAAVLPADIKIEAVLYAEDNSFFVIPGDWFNTDTADVLNQSPGATAGTYSASRPADRVADYRFPYHGQPIDMQITIDGSITENMPADIADQAAWMQKWGWIPRYHGSQVGTAAAAAEVSPHAPTTPTGIGVGLNFVYDPLNGFPVVNPAAGSPTYIRQDQYGRPLPSVPALPVSPDLLYNGQPTSRTTQD